MHERARIRMTRVPEYTRWFSSFDHRPGIKHDEFVGDLRQQDPPADMARLGRDKLLQQALGLRGLVGAQLQERENGEEVTLAGVIEGYREKVPKSGGRMAFFFLEDGDDGLKIVLGDSADAFEPQSIATLPFIRHRGTAAEAAVRKLEGQLKLVSSSE